MGSRWEHSEAELGCLLCLLPGLPQPQPHSSVFVWTHPSVAGGRTPRDLLGKGQDVWSGYLFYLLLWYQCLMVFTCCLFCLSYLLSFPIFMYLLCDITEKCSSTEIEVDEVNSERPQSLIVNQRYLYVVECTWQKESSIIYYAVEMQVFCLVRTWVCCPFCLLYCFLS